MFVLGLQGRGLLVTGVSCHVLFSKSNVLIVTDFLISAKEIYQSISKTVLAKFPLVCVCIQFMNDNLLL